MGASFLKENIESMIISKLSEEEVEEESIRQILDGIDFEERLSGCFIDKVKEEKSVDVEVVVTTADIVQRISRVIKNECYPNFKVFKGGRLTYQTLEYLWKNHKAATQEYFILTDELHLFKSYEEEEGKKPVYGGELTFTYIYWLYKSKMSELIDFISKLYPIL